MPSLTTDAVKVEPFKPNETAFAFEKEMVPEAKTFVVPALSVGSIGTVGTVYEAVITELFDIPKLMPFEFEKTAVPLVTVCVPAAIPAGAVDCE